MGLDVPESDGGVLGEDEVGVAVGRFKIFRTGWNAAGGGDVAAGLPVLDPAMRSCGIGARWFLAIE